MDDDSRFVNETENSAKAAQVSARELLFGMIRLIVSDPDAVCVTSQGDGTLLVRVKTSDLERLIRDGRTIRALEKIVNAKKGGTTYCKVLVTDN